MLLTREQILAAQDVAAREINVPEWGGAVRLRAMTGVDRDEYMSAFIKAQKSGDVAQHWNRLIALLVVLCAVDDKGGRLFARDDIDVLVQKSADVLSRIHKEVESVNALGPEQVEELGNG